MKKFIYFDIGNIFHTVDKVFTTAPKDVDISNEDMLIIYDEFSNDLTIGKISVHDFWNICCQRLNISGGENYDIAKSWANDYVIIPETHQLAGDLSAKYEIGILSNHFNGMFPETIKQGKIPDLNYKTFIISAETGFRKPQSEIYDLAENKSGFTGDDIFFIDDQQKNIDEAIRHGWQTFLFDYKHPQESVDKLRAILL